MLVPLLAALLTLPAPAQVLRGSLPRPVLPSAAPAAVTLAAPSALTAPFVALPAVLAAPAPPRAVNAAAPEPAKPAAAAKEQLEAAAGMNPASAASEVLGAAAAGKDGAAAVPAAVFDGAQAPSPEEELAALRAENAALRSRLSEHERMVAKAVHDLRNPLTPLDGYAQLLEMDGLSDKQKRHVGQIRAAARRLGGMLSDLLDYSRAGAAPLKPAPLDLGLLVGRVADAFAAQAAARGVRVELDLPAGLVASADEGLMQRVVENLVSNGIKYNREGGRLRLSAARVPGGVELAFSDEGIGIPPEDLPRLFSPFYRTDAARAAAPGNGLGLSSVKAAVERHGGRVSVESAPGRGATFRVFLPA